MEAGDVGRIRSGEKRVNEAANPTVVRHVEVRNKAGLHARPATMLAMKAKEYDAEIELVLQAVPEDHHLEAGTRADAKNSIELISLGARPVRRSRSRPPAARPRPPPPPSPSSSTAASAWKTISVLAGGCAPRSHDGSAVVPP